jgi:hypothetical protein
MTPKEKAKELVVKYYEEFIKDYQVLACLSDEIRNSIYNKRETFAKKCALIAIQELIDQCWDYREIDLEKSCDYWKEVKEEIYKL